MNIATTPRRDLDRPALFGDADFTALAYELARRTLKVPHDPEDGALACALLDNSAERRDITLVSAARNLLWAAPGTTADAINAWADQLAGDLNPVPDRPRLLHRVLSSLAAMRR
jgi:hypothetical protein